MVYVLESGPPPVVHVIGSGECRHPSEVCASGVCGRCGQPMLDFRVVDRGTFWEVVYDRPPGLDEP